MCIFSTKIKTIYCCANAASKLGFSYCLVIKKIIYNNYYISLYAVCTVLVSVHYTLQYNYDSVRLH